MVFKREEKVILKAVMEKLEEDDNNPAYTPVEKDNLKTGLDEIRLNITLDNMAQRGLLFVAGDHVTLSDKGVNAYSLLKWVEKNINEE